MRAFALLALAATAGGFTAPVAQPRGLAARRAGPGPSCGPVPLAPPALAALAVGDAVTVVRPSNGREVVATRLSLRPAAFLLQGLQTAEECAELKARAAAEGMVPAETNGETDARRRCAIGCLRPDSQIVEALTRDVARLMLSDRARGPGGGSEDLHVLRYEPGGEFTLHYDTFPETPRALTVLHYLNGVGATWFPLADRSPEPTSLEDMRSTLAELTPPRDGLHVAGRAGDTLAFYNYGEDGERERLSLHAGLPAPSTRWVGSHFYRSGDSGG